MLNNKMKNVGFCDFCNKLQINKQIYSIYRLGFTTTLQFYTVGILNISEELGDYLIKRGCHLSATQVMLLRPDILLDFLRKKYNSPLEKVINAGLTEAEMCETCYNNEYIQEVPEK